MLRDTQRIKQCFRQSADDQIGSVPGVVATATTLLLRAPPPSQRCRIANSTTAQGHAARHSALSANTARDQA
eukprot:5444506-Prymnesium_polylepis.1